MLTRVPTLGTCPLERVISVLAIEKRRQETWDGSMASQILAESQRPCATAGCVTSEPKFARLHDVLIGCSLKAPPGSQKSRILFSLTLVFPVIHTQ